MLSLWSRNLKITKWQLRYIRLAYEVATWSKDPDCAVGAVLVSPDGCQVSHGYNGFPRGISDRAERLLNKQIKNAMMVHAEVNAILNCHADTRGWALYCTKAPCHHCAGAIIQAGITSVVFPELNPDSSWRTSGLLAISMFAEAGINMTRFASDLDVHERFTKGL